MLATWGAHDREDPFPLFAEVRRQGPLHPVTLADGHDAWLVIGYDEAKAALGDPRLSKDMQAAMAMDDAVVAEGLPGPAFARHMLAVDPPHHTRLRGLVSRAFTPRRVQRLAPRVEQIAAELLDGLALSGPGPLDLVAGFAFPLPFTVICELLGVPDEVRTALGDGLRAMLVPVADPAEFERAKVASGRVVAMLGELVEHKRRVPADDLVSGLIAARDGEDRLDEQELMSTVFQLIVAGHDTTTSLIGNAVVALLRHPAQLERVRADPTLVDAVVEEALRFDAPVPHSTFRYALETVELGGRTIPAGAQVIICLSGANRDPARYADPDTFDVSRSDRSLAFGHGIHHCLGAPLARMEGRIALKSLLRSFPEMRLATEVSDLRWGHGDGLVLRGLSSLPVMLGRPASS